MILKKRYISIVWFLLWLPISQLFPTHIHFPLGPVLAPIAAWFAPFSAGTKSNLSFDLQYLYFPALFFWGGGVLFVYGVGRVLGGIK